MKTTTRMAPVRLIMLIVGLSLVAAACTKDDDKDKASLKDEKAPSSSGTRLSQDEVGKLKTVAPGKLTACTDTSSRPFGFEEGGKIDGIDPELIRGLAGRFALSGEFVAMPGKDTLAAIDAGKCDIAGMAMTEAAKKTHLFSEPYFVVYPSLLVRAADAEKYKDLASLDGRTVGVVGGSTGAGYAKKKAGAATVKEFSASGGASELFAALEGRQIDAVIHDLPVNAFRASSSGGKTAVTKIFTDGEKKIHALAMRKDRADLKKVVDDGLVQVKSDDTYPTVLRRFVGDFAAQALKDVGGP